MKKRFRLLSNMLTKSICKYKIHSSLHSFYHVYTYLGPKYWNEREKSIKSASQITGSHH